MKKLAILIYSLAGGGAERVVSILLNELKDNYDITLVLMNKTIHYDLPENQKIIYLENSTFDEHGLLKLLKLPWLGYRYKNYCKQHAIEINFSLMNRPNYIALFAKLFGSRSKTIINERAMPSLQHKKGIQGLVNRWLITYLYPFADTVIANSIGNSLDLSNNFGIQPVYTINNPFDLTIISALKEKRINLIKEKFTFVTVGRLDEGKNHRLTVEAMQNIDANLWIIGDGPLRNTLDNQIKQLHLENNVFLLGRQDNPFKYLNIADCFIFSSNHEGFPNVLIEALACGLPIISTDCQSGPREILAPNSNQDMCLKHNIELSQYGILTPINDIHNLEKAMNTIITNENLRDSYKIKSRQRAQDFSKEKIILQFIKAIEDISNETKGIQCVE